MYYFPISEGDRMLLPMIYCELIQLKFHFPQTSFMSQTSN